jgi:hypothetical protein
MRQHRPVPFFSRKSIHNSPLRDFEAVSANPSMLKPAKYRKKIGALATQINIGKPMATC